MRLTEPDAHSESDIEASESAPDSRNEDPGIQDTGIQGDAQDADTGGVQETGNIQGDAQEGDAAAAAMGAVDENSCPNPPGNWCSCLINVS